MARKKQSRNSKLRESLEMISTLFPGDEPVDLGKTYVKKRTLSSKWVSIFNEREEIGLHGTVLKHLPSEWMMGKRYRKLDDEDFLQGSLDDNIDFGIYKGSDLVKLLDTLRSELGPDPKKSLVMGTSDGYEVVVLEDTSDAALNKCLDQLRKFVKEAESYEQKKAERKEQHAQQVELAELISKMGATKALALLKK